MAQAAAAVQGKGKGKKAGIQLNFSELDDLFLNTKGKAMRNLRKKMEKYQDLDKQVRAGSLQANAQQKQQIDSVPQLKSEIAELEALCKLYMESNPTWDKKAAPAISEEDLKSAVTDSLTLLGQALSLNGLIKEDSSFVECSAEESSSLAALESSLDKLTASSAKGSATFGKGKSIGSFADAYTKLALGSDDSVTEGGVSFDDLKALVSRSFSDNAQIMQRIADKELSAKRAQQAAEEEAARKAAEARAAEDAARAEAEAAAAEAEAQAQAQAKAQAKAKAKAAEQEAQATAAEESKGTSEARQEGEAAASEAKVEGQADQGAAQETPRDGGRGGRGGRRGDGDRRGRGEHRGGHRGDREYRGGNRGGGRGRYNRGPREDEDGFVMETGEKPKPRRDNYRGRRGAERGEFRGGRGGRDGDWNRRGRGARPETATGGDQQQPAAQASTTQE